MQAEIAQLKKSLRTASQPGSVGGNIAAGAFLGRSSAAESRHKGDSESEGVENTEAPAHKYDGPAPKASLRPFYWRTLSVAQCRGTVWAVSKGLYRERAQEKLDAEVRVCYLFCFSLVLFRVLF